MILFTRMQDDNAIIKNENGEIKAIIVQTYKEINVEGVELVKQDTFNGLKCEPYIRLKTSDNEEMVFQSDITNLNDADIKELRKQNEGVYITENTKGKQLKYKTLPCKVCIRNKCLYACIDYDLIIYNVSKIK